MLINISELQDRFDEILDRAENGEIFTVEIDGVAKALITPPGFHIDDYSEGVG